MLCALKRSYHSVFIYPDGYFDVFFEYILSLKSSDFPGLPNDIWLLSVVEKSTKKIYIFARIYVQGTLPFRIRKNANNTKCQVCEFWDHFLQNIHVQLFQKVLKTSYFQNLVNFGITKHALPLVL